MNGQWIVGELSAVDHYERIKSPSTSFSRYIGKKRGDMIINSWWKCIKRFMGLGHYLFDFSTHDLQRANRFAKLNK